MDDYIKRSDVLALQTELRFDQIEQLKHYRCRHIDPLSVKLLDAADVRENVRGEWVTSNNCPDFVFCSVCKKNKDPNAMAWKKSYIKAVNGIFKFCPVCGADMRKKENKKNERKN